MLQKLNKLDCWKISSLSINNLHVCESNWCYAQIYSYILYHNIRLRAFLRQIFRAKLNSDKTIRTKTMENYFFFLRFLNLIESGKPKRISKTRKNEKKHSHTIFDCVRCTQVFKLLELPTKTCSILNYLNRNQTQRTQWKQRWDEVSLFVFRFRYGWMVRLFENVKVLTIVVYRCRCFRCDAAMRCFRCDIFFLIFFSFSMFESIKVTYMPILCMHLALKKPKTKIQNAWNGLT